MKIAGIVLIVLGMMALVLQGISYTTQEERIDVGPVQASTEDQHYIPLPPILGGVALVGGVGLVIAGSRKP